MSSDSKLLILSAGRGVGLDGFHKLKLVSAQTNETILQRYIRQLSANITIVVGYRAPEIMAENPGLTYRYNYNWFETGSAFSAHLGLSTVPVIIVPSDLFICDVAAQQIMQAEDNVIFTLDTENRGVNAINVSENGGFVSDMYLGPKRSGADDEFCGIVRIKDLDLLSAISQECEKNSSAAFSDCVATHKDKFRVIQLQGSVREINTVEDYVSYFEDEVTK